MVGHDRVHDRRAIVRQHHLLEQAPQHLAHAIVSSPFVEVAGGAELGQHVARPFNGPGEHLRKEAHKSEEGGRIAHRLQFAAVHIKGVTEALERVETDAHRQHQAERARINGSAQEGEGLDEAREEEVVVLEETQQAQVGHQAHGHQQPAARRRLCALQAQSHQIVHPGREQPKHEVARVPPAIEHAAGGDQEDVARPDAPPEHTPVQAEHQRQEQGEVDGVEQHGRSLFRTGAAKVVIEKHDPQ